jgi:hypothetical protein
MSPFARERIGLFSALVLAAFWTANAPSAAPQIPDVIVYDVGVDGGNTNDIHYYGQNGGIAAYSIATQSCNKGTDTVDWFSGSSTLHPVIAQNMFRYKGGRFEHVGQSWLKHGFCAVNEIEAFCAPCQSTPCDSLGIGCADTYWATLNDGGSGQSKRWVNATNGTHTHSGGPSGNTTIRGRLQVAVSDIDPAQNSGAQWFIEGHYVTADDAQAGASANNASWRRVNVLAVNNIDGGGATQREEPAIFAWKTQDALVEIQEAQNIETGGAKTSFYVGYRVTALGSGRWSYEYAIQNLNSDQSAGSLSIPVHPQAMVTNIDFHDVAYHSGDPYDGTNWPGVKNAGEIRWATTPHSVNVNANAMRWGTLYNFRFIANSAPARGPITIGLFKPSVNTDIQVNDVWVPTEIPVHGGHASQNGPPAPLSGGGISVPLVVSRPGTRPNPDVLVPLTNATVGGRFETTLELDGVLESVLFISAGQAEGNYDRLGEVLIQTPMQIVDGSTLAIPNDARLAGRTFSVQAAVRTETGWRLTNALDVTIGAAQ